MHYFRYAGNRLYCEGVAVEALARRFGTPLYVYSQRTLTEHFQDLDRALAGVEHLVCFAVKSNSNLSVLRVLALGARRRLAPRASHDLRAVRQSRAGIRPGLTAQSGPDAALTLCLTQAATGTAGAAILAE